MHWNVEISGNRDKLELLALVLNTPELEIVRVHNRFSLRSTRFSPRARVRHIDEQALEIVKVLNGAAKLALGGSPEIKLTGLSRIRENGFDEHYAPSLAGQELSDFVWSQVYKRKRPSADRSEPAHPIPNWLLLGLGDDAVRTVFEILGTGPLGWQDIDILMSIVETDLQGESLPEQISCLYDARRQLARRRDAAAAVPETGSEARDRGEQSAEDPPEASAFYLSEARLIVNLLLHRWLARKIGAAA